MVTNTPRKWTEEAVRYYIQTDDKWLYGALKALYKRQTEGEQRTGTTRYRNGVGFNGCDAPFLSSVARFYLEKGYLTYKQKIVTRKKMDKYTKQLTRIANKEI